MVKTQVCVEPGCPELTIGIRCTAHQSLRDRARDAHRGSSAKRGYGYAHKKRRKKVEAFVLTGRCRCARGSKCRRAELVNGQRVGGIIRPGEAWDLDHSDDRTTYIGASHSSCNRGAGARRNRARRIDPFGTHLASCTGSSDSVRVRRDAA